MLGVHPEGCDTKKYKPSFETTVKFSGGKTETDFEYHLVPDRENPPNKRHKLFFTANSQRCKEVQSELLEICFAVRAYVYRKHGIPVKNTEFTIKGHGDNSFTVKTDEAGYFEKTDCLPHRYTLEIAGHKKTWSLPADKVKKIILGDSVTVGSD